MRTILLAILCVPFVAAAIEPVAGEKEVICSTPTAVFAAVQTLYEEYPIWHGDSQKESSVVITANPDTGSWSIIQYDKDMACVLEIGEGFRFRDPKQLKL